MKKTCDFPTANWTHFACDPRPFRALREERVGGLRRSGAATTPEKWLSLEWKILILNS